MRAKDLMIGDWVKSRGKIEQVREVYDGYICTDSFEDSHDYYFDPIPLTSEILEKNGFEKQFDYQWEYRDNSCKIIISIAPQIEIDGEIIGTPPINIMLKGALFTIDITDDYSVHQLQHALRLCGIEKEITI